MLKKNYTFTKKSVFFSFTKFGGGQNSHISGTHSGIFKPKALSPCSVVTGWHHESGMLARSLANYGPSTAFEEVSVLHVWCCRGPGQEILHAPLKEEPRSASSYNRYFYAKLSSCILSTKASWRGPDFGQDTAPIPSCKKHLWEILQIYYTLNPAESVYI